MKRFIVFIAAILLSANSFALKILLVENATTQTIESSGAFTISVPETGNKYKLKEGGKFKAVISGGKIKVGSVDAKGTVTLKPSKNTIFTIAGNGYTGSIILLPSAKDFDVIEETNMESYLYGVLPYEMSYSWHIEALKAQAVAARTYTAKSIESPVNKKFDLYSDVRSQMYKGSAKIYPSVKEAVDDTRKEVLEYDGKMFFTYYHANCGGHTDPLPWGGVGNKIKPLSGATCGFCDNSSGAKWKRNFSNSDIQKFVNRKGLKGTLKDVKVTKKTSTGRATQVTVKTTEGSQAFSCNDFRIGIGSTKLKSCWITDIKKVSGGIDFAGRGYGHGTGLCQEGAHAMAKDGKKYKDILYNFYPGAKITKL